MGRGDGTIRTRAATGGVILALASAALPSGAADFLRLDGHGGPIKGVAIAGDRALTASFDYAVGLWSLQDGGQKARLTGHRAGVNAVAFLPDGRAVSGGDDFMVHLWDLERGTSQQMAGHKGKVFAFALSPDGNTLASAGWDGWIGLWDLGTATLIRLIDGHRSNVTDVAFGADGALYSASSDGTIRQWDTATGTEKIRLADHGFGVNTLLVDQAGGWLAYGGLDGGTRVIDIASGALLADLTLDRRPILAMAARPDGKEIAVGDGEGYIMVVRTDTWRILRDFRAARRGPVWALAYTADGTGLLAGGLDDAAYLWPLDGEAPDIRMAEEERSFLRDPDKMDNGARQFYRKCSICHTLTPDDAGRAGPSLYGVFGRRAGALPGYPYSQAMRRSDIIWNAQTIAKLFEIGPDYYTPGSKMPMQRIARAQDRADLIEFLRRETGESE